MKNKVIITIPDTLTDQEEKRLNSERLVQKQLSFHGNELNKLRIGNNLEVKNLTTQIIINRTGEKPIEFIPCNVCGCDYQSNLFKIVFVNYGGKNKSIKVCSENCQHTLIEICGKGRAALKLKQLTPVRFF